MANQDAMTRDIRKNIKALFDRVPKHLIGTGKLFLSSAKDMFEVDMPVLKSMYETNQDLLKDTLKVLRNPAEAINKQVTRITSSAGYLELQKLGKYALDDLRTGNFYEKDRMRSVDDGLEDSMSEFGGFDMSFDENGDWSEDAGISDIDSEAGIAQVQEDNADVRTEAVIDAIGTATEASITTANANTQASLRMSLKQHAQQMNGLQNLITSQGATFELMSQSINAQLEVTREAHQQVMDKMDAITNLLGEIRDGIIIKPKEEEKVKSQQMFTRAGAINIKGYLKRVIENIDDKYNVRSNLAILTGGSSAETLIQAFQDNPFKLVSDAILKAVVPKDLRSHMKDTNAGLAGLFPALIQKAYTAGQNFEADSDGKGAIAKMLAGLFGVTNWSNSAIDIRPTNPLAAAQLTQKTTKAIEDIIPMWLSKIYTAISGEPLKIYDYTSGELKRANDVLAENIRNATDLYGKVGSTRYAINKGIRAFQFKNSDDTDDFKDFMYRYMQNKAESGEFINPHMSLEEFEQDFSSASGSLRGVHRAKDYYPLVTALFKSMPDSVRLGMARDIMYARDKRHTGNQGINKNLMESGLATVFSGFVDKEDVTDIEHIATTRNDLLTGDQLDNTLQRYRNNRDVRMIGPKATNYLLNDLLATIKRGIITYSYSMGEVNNTEASQKIMAAVREAADDQHALDTKIRSAIEDDKLRKDESKNAEEKEYNKKLEDSNRTPDKILVTDGMDSSIAEAIQRLSAVAKTEEGESGNKQTEQYRKWFQTNVMDKGQKLADDAANATGVKGLIANLQKLAMKPFEKFDEALNMADALMLKMVFGEDTEFENDDSTEEGGPHLLGMISKSIEIHFKNAANWFKDNVGLPTRDLLLDANDGIFPKLRKEVGELFGFKDGKNPIKDAFSKMEERFLGTKIEEHDADGKVISSRREGGKFSGAVNRVNDKFRSFKSGSKAGVDDFITRFLYGNYGSTKGVSTYMDIDDSGDYVVGRDYGGIVGWFKELGHDFKELMLGPDGEKTDSKEKWKTVTDELHKAYPDMIVGGGVGLLASFFLPGGPILGAALGSTAGLIHGSDKLKEFLFGKFSDEDEIIRDKAGNPVIDRKTGKPKTRKVQTATGLLDREIVDGFKQFFPGIAIGAGAGGLIGSMGLLPFGLGGAAGTVIGGITGMLASSDQVKELIFGNITDDDSGLISKNFRKKTVEAVKKYAPPIIGTAAAGGVLGHLLGMGLGLIPGLAMLPTGPVFGIMGALVGLANAEQINKFFFGDEVEETREVDDGKGGKKTVTSKRREGGLFGGIHDFVRDKMVIPFGEKINETGHKIQGWFQESIVTPLRNSMEPLKQHIAKAGESVFGSLKNIGEKITDSIFKVFNISLNGDDGEGGLKAWFHDKVLKRLDAMANKIFDTVGRILGKIIAAPFKAFELLVTGKINGESLDDLAEARDKKRKEKRDARRDKQRARALTRANKSLGRAGGLFAALFNRLTGQVEPNGQNKDKPEGDKTAQPDTKTKAPGTDVAKPGEATADIGGSITNPNELKRHVENAANDARHIRDDANGGNSRWSDNKYSNQTAASPTGSTSITPDPVAAIPSAADLDQQAKSEAATREKTKKSIRAKSNNDYLKEIAKSTSGIFNEIKGQLGGTGWNVAYIKALLDKQFEPLSAEELPEEMEGSKKVKKRRGILGKAKDAVFGAVGHVKDVVGGAIGRVLDVVTKPINLLINVVLGAKEAVKKFATGLLEGLKLLGSFAVETVKAVGGMVKEIGMGLAQGIGKTLEGVGEVIKRAAGGIGEALGNIASTITGVLHDATLAISSTVLGLFQIAAAVAPDIALSLWDGAKWITKKAIKGVGKVAGGIWKGVKGLARGAKRGASWLWGKITGRGKKKKDGSDGGTPSSMYIDGGTLDSLHEIVEPVPVAVGGSLHIPYPVVSLSRGKLAEAVGIRYAIPVYIVGSIKDKSDPDRKKAKQSPTDGKNTPKAGNDADEDNDVRKYIDAYRDIDDVVERSNNPAEEYDKAMRNAKTPEEIEAVRDSHQLNTGSKLSEAVEGEGGKKEKSDGLISKILDAFTGGKAGTIGKILGALGVITPLAAATYNFTSEDGHTSWGLRNLTTAFNNGRKKLAKVKGSTAAASLADFMKMVKSPAYANASAAFGDSLGTRLKGRAATGVSKLGEMIHNGAAQVGGKLAPIVDAAKSKLGEGATAVAKRFYGFGDAVKYGADATLDKAFGSGKIDTVLKNTALNINDIGRIATGAVGADEVAKMGPVKKAIAKVINKLLSNATVKKMFGALSNKIGTVAKKLTTFISDKVLKKAVQTGGKNMIKNAGKQIAAFLSGGTIQVLFSVADFISGFGNAKKYFNVFGSDVSLAMRLTSAVVNTLAGLLNLIFGIGPMLAVAVSLFQDQIVQLVYNELADDGARQELAQDQAKLQSATDAYNAANGTDLTSEEYAKQFNEDGSKKKQGILSKIGGAIGGIGKAIGEGVTGAVGAAGRFLGGVGGAIGKGIGVVGGALGKGIGALVGGVGEFIRDPLGSINRVFNVMIPYALGYTITTVMNFVGGIGDAITAFFTNAVATVRRVFGDIRDTIVEIAGNVVTFVTELPGRVIEWCGNTWNTITTGVSNIAATIEDFIVNIPSRITQMINGITRTVTDTIRTVVANVTEFVTSIPGRIWDFITAGPALWLKSLNAGRQQDNYDEYVDSLGMGPGNNTSSSSTTTITNGNMDPQEALHNVGRGIGDRLITMMSEVFKQRNSAPGLFNLIGEGLGSSLLDDLRKTDGNKANLNTVMTNAVGTSVAAAASSSSKTDPWYVRAAGAVKNFFGWGKGPDVKDKKDDFDIDMEWGTGIKPMSQKDSRWNRSDSKMATTGCGPTAAAIVASRYDQHANPAEANAASRQLGMRAPDGGTNPAFFGQYASRHGYGMQQGPVSGRSIQGSLNRNQPVVVMGKGGAFGSNMHYMVADRSNNNGTVGLIDPLSGGRRSTTMDSLLTNTKDAIYSYGKGPKTPEDQSTTSDGSVSTGDAQQKLTQKMEWLSQHPIEYSLEGPQDPDKGSASCASTVGWAYRKVFGDDLKGMSASSREQSKDSRFTTIWGNPANHDTQPGKLLDFSIMQPGDIVYMKNPKTNHTEMYAGNGMTWSHGGPDPGPTLRKLDETRQKRVWAINRYTPFLNGQPVQVREGDLVAAGGSAAAATAGTVVAGNDELSSLFTPDGADGKFTSGGLLSAFLGLGNIFGQGITNALSALLGNGADAEGAEGAAASGGMAKNSGRTTKGSSGGEYTGTSNLTRDESKKTIWKFLHDQGYNDIGAAGIMGCWQEESFNNSKSGLGV